MKEILVLCYDFPLLPLSLYSSGIRKSRIQVARCGLATVGSGDNPGHVALLARVRAR